MRNHQLYLVNRKKGVMLSIFSRTIFMLRDDSNAVKPKIISKIAASLCWHDNKSKL